MTPTLPKDVEERINDGYIPKSEYNLHAWNDRVKSIVATEIERAKQEEQSIVHAVFWCNWCEKHVPREEVSIGEHTTTGATIFSHNNNHLLEVREFQPNTKEEE